MPHARLIVHPLARQDIDEAALWYERRSPGLGYRFSAVLDAVLDAVAVAPEQHARVYRDVRRAGVRPFPFAVYYVTRDAAIHVIACMHERRRPDRWRRRARGL